VGIAAFGLADKVALANAGLETQRRQDLWLGEQTDGEPGGPRGLPVISTHLREVSPGNAMSKLFEKVKEEFIALLPPTIFFFITLHLVAVIRVLMLKGTGIPVSTSLQVTVAALILGKSVLIADLLPFINLYPHKPLIYNVVWKTAIYLLVSMFVHYLERLADFWKEAGGFVAGNQKLLAEMVWPHFWAIQLVLLVLIFFYCTIRELVRVIGRDKVNEIFFGTPPAAWV
jgi:hypothetical protein